MVLCSNVRTERVRLARVALSAFALVAMALPVKYATVAEAKTPGSRYCFHGTCHRVKTLAETRALVGVDQTLYASHYDDCKNDRYNPCGLTSSGERFHANRPDNTASPIYPDGTTLLVWNPNTERALVVRVNNAGPYWGNRTLDLSRAAARKLGFEGKGVAKLKVRVIKAPDKKESRYSRNRNYPPVPGDIGEYASLDEAQTGMAVALALQASAASPLAPVTAANVFGEEAGDEPLVAEAPQAPGRYDRNRYAERADDSQYVRAASLGLSDIVPQSHWSGRPSLPRIASLVSVRRPGQRMLQSIWDGEDFVDQEDADASPRQQVALASAVEEALKRSAASDATPKKSKSSSITTGSITTAAAKKDVPKQVAAKTAESKKDEPNKVVAQKAEPKKTAEPTQAMKVAALITPPMPEGKPADVRAKAKADLAAAEAAKKVAAAEAAEKAAAQKRAKKRYASAKKKRTNTSANRQRVASNNSGYRNGSRYRKYDRVAETSGGYWGAIARAVRPSSFSRRT